MRPVPNRLRVLRPAPSPANPVPNTYMGVGLHAGVNRRPPSLGWPPAPLVCMFGHMRPCARSVRKRLRVLRPAPSPAHPVPSACMCMGVQSQVVWGSLTQLATLPPCLGDFCFVPCGPMPRVMRPWRSPAHPVPNAYMGMGLHAGVNRRPPALGSQLAPLVCVCGIMRPAARCRHAGRSSCGENHQAHPVPSAFCGEAHLSSSHSETPALGYELAPLGVYAPQPPQPPCCGPACTSSALPPNQPTLSPVHFAVKRNTRQVIRRPPSLCCPPAPLSVYKSAGLFVCVGLAVVML